MTINHYWKAVWEHDGKTKTRYFSIDRLGDEEAFKAACKHRKEMIELLNNAGAGYTERHGT
jgi:hypothetical protein